MKHKILSFLTAFAMVFGILAAPFTNASAADEAKKTTKSVTLHKLVMSKQNLSDWDSKALEKKGYNGTQNTDQLKALLDEGHTAKEVAGVYFAVKYNSGDNKGKYVTINEADKENPVYGAVDSLDGQLPDGYKLLAGKTEANGIVFNTIGLEGNFSIEEIHEKSSYVGDDGEAITDSKAVPVDITLPL
ncbi:MAG: pilin N-terminal domain-containing protein, partial [Anaerococcus hydrogenalis]|nr:pilin N-terminal domain-containing protein [Anaerococcus hydrogenalis]